MSATDAQRASLAEVVDGCRRDIDELDELIVAAVARRRELAQRIAAARRAAGAPLVDPPREDDIRQWYVRELGQHGADLADAALACSRAVIAEGR